jgi:asparaginyl-tRNA synthetase
MSEEKKTHSTQISHILDDPEKYFDKTVTVNGWVKTARKQKLVFALISDGSCVQYFQVIFDDKNFESDQEKLYKNLITGCSLTVTGKVIKSPKPKQPVELHATEYKVHGMIADKEYPISKNELTIDFLRQIPHLRSRTDLMSALMRIKSTAKFAVAEYFDKQSIPEVQVPLITDNECESGACPFTVSSIIEDGSIAKMPMKDNVLDFTRDFFGKRVYLTVSAQLHLEALVCGALSKAWCMTTAFRAEPSTGPMHLGEFWMLEYEKCFGTLKDNMETTEGVIKFAISKVLDRNMKDLEFLQERNKPDLIETLKRHVVTPFAVSSHEECVKQMLKDQEEGKVKFETQPKYDEDLAKEHERYITKVLFKGPVFVRYFPTKVKAFYMPEIDAGQGKEVTHVDGFDLLMDECGEIAGGSQRISDYDDLMKRMAINKIDPKSLEFYSDLRKYGTVPHGGAGIGFDRLMLVLTGEKNVRDVVPFPRSYKACAN